MNLIKFHLKSAKGSKFIFNIYVSYGYIYIYIFFPFSFCVNTFSLDWKYKRSSFGTTSWSLQIKEHGKFCIWFSCKVIARRSIWLERKGGGGGVTNKRQNYWKPSWIWWCKVQIFDGHGPKLLDNFNQLSSSLIHPKVVYLIYNSFQSNLVLVQFSKLESFGFLQITFNRDD